MSLVVPNTLGNSTTSISLSLLDENFAYFRDQLNPYVNAITVGSANAVTLNGTVTVSSNLNVNGNLTVSGTTVTVNTTNTTVKDSLIELNNGAATNANDIGIIFQRGSTGANGAFVWDETNDRFSLGTTTATGSSTGALTITKGSLSANLVGNADTVTNGVYTTNFSGTNQSIATNGFQKLPGGLIMQWGYFTAGTSYTLTFPMAFPTGVLTFQLTGADSAATDTDGFDMVGGVTGAVSTTGCRLSTVNGRNYYWFAIGY